MEHDPLEIWANTEACVTGALAKAGLSPSDLAAVGITNQRETTVVWDPATGKPFYNAIVWNCARYESTVPMKWCGEWCSSKKRFSCLEGNRQRMNSGLGFTAICEG